MKRIILSTMLFLSASTLFAQVHNKTNTVTKSTSVSVSNSENSYTLYASFDNGASDQINTIIVNALGSGVKTADNGTLWQVKDIYTLTLKSDKFAMELNKDKASGTLTNSLIKLGKDIDQAINNTHPAPSSPQTPGN